MDNHIDKAKEATKEVLGNWSAECEELSDSLKAAAAKNAQQDQSIEVLKQELANLKVNEAKKGEAIEKNGGNEWPIVVRAWAAGTLQPVFGKRMPKKILSMIDKRFLIKTKKLKQR